MKGVGTSGYSTSTGGSLDSIYQDDSRAMRIQINLKDFLFRKYSTLLRPLRQLEDKHSRLSWADIMLYNTTNYILHL
jgi:hypothetical protein